MKFRICVIIMGKLQSYTFLKGQRLQNNIFVSLAKELKSLVTKHKNNNGRIEIAIYLRHRRTNDGEYEVRDERYN